jgi:hypothetical protein
MKHSGGAALLAVALLVACDGDEAQQVNVSLVEFAVTARPDTVKAGTVVFEVHNDGELPVHEFVVVRTDLTIPQLPTNPDGSFNEEGEGVIVIDEIEEIRRGEPGFLKLDLAAGHYVLLCNIVVVTGTGQVRSHFAEGMRTDFTVH